MSPLKADLSGALNYLEQIVTQFRSQNSSHAAPRRTIKRDGARRRNTRKIPVYRVLVCGILHARALYKLLSLAKDNAAHGFYERTFLGYPHLAEWSARAYLADAKALIGMGEKQDAINTFNEAVVEISRAPADILKSIKAKLSSDEFRLHKIPMHYD